MGAEHPNIERLDLSTELEILRREMSLYGVPETFKLPLEYLFVHDYEVSVKLQYDPDTDKVSFRFFTKSQFSDVEYSSESGAVRTSTPEWIINKFDVTVLRLLSKMTEYARKNGNQTIPVVDWSPWDWSEKNYSARLRNKKALLQANPFLKIKIQEKYGPWAVSRTINNDELSVLRDITEEPDGSGKSGLVRNLSMYYKLAPEGVMGRKSPIKEDHFLVRELMHTRDEQGRTYFNGLCRDMAKQFLSFSLSVMKKELEYENYYGARSQLVRQRKHSELLPTQDLFSEPVENSLAEKLKENPLYQRPLSVVVKKTSQPNSLDPVSEGSKPRGIFVLIDRIRRMAGSFLS